LPEYRRAVELMSESPPSERALIPLRPLRSAAGDLPGAVEAATQGLEIARRLGLREEICRSYTNGSDALHQAGQIEESIAMALDGIRWAHDFGFDRQWGAFVSAEVAGRLVQVGRWRDAEERLREIVDYRPRGVTAGTAYTHLGQLLALRSEFDAAAHALDQADEHVRRSSASMWLAPPAAARATLELGAGRPDDARRIVRTCLARVADGELLFFTAALYELGIRAGADVAGAAPASAVAERRDARELTARMQRLIDLPAVAVPPLVSASRAACAAECSRIGGAGDPVLWSEARRHWELCGDVHATAYAAWREAEALLAAGGDRGAAEALVREAHGTATSLGARPLREGLEGLDDQPRDPGRAAHQRQDGERPRLADPLQALGADPRRGGRRRRAPGRAPRERPSLTERPTTRLCGVTQEGLADNRSH
jgi:tetratricopeptide (TPR) repeat protein